MKIVDRKFMVCPKSMGTIEVTKYENGDHKIERYLVRPHWYGGRIQQWEVINLESNIRVVAATTEDRAVQSAYEWAMYDVQCMTPAHHALRDHKRGVIHLTKAALKDQIFKVYDDNFDRLKKLKEFKVI